MPRVLDFILLLKVLCLFLSRGFFFFISLQFETIPAIEINFTDLKLRRGTDDKMELLSILLGSISLTDWLAANKVAKLNYQSASVNWIIPLPKDYTNNTSSGQDQRHGSSANMIFTVTIIIITVNVTHSHPPRHHNAHVSLDTDEVDGPWVHPQSIQLTNGAIEFHMSNRALALSLLVVTGVQ